MGLYNRLLTPPKRARPKSPRVPTAAIFRQVICNTQRGAQYKIFAINTKLDKEITIVYTVNYLHVLATVGNTVDKLRSAQAEAGKQHAKTCKIHDKSVHLYKMTGAQTG